MQLTIAIILIIVIVIVIISNLWQRETEEGALFYAGDDWWVEERKPISHVDFPLLIIMIELWSLISFCLIRYERHSFIFNINFIDFSLLLRIDIASVIAVVSFISLWKRIERTLETWNGKKSSKSGSELIKPIN